MFTKSLVSFMTCIVWQFTKANRLPLCDTDTNLTDRRLCKLSLTYPVLPVTIQPVFTILELLELDGNDKSMTITLQSMMKWNDTGVTTVGPKGTSYGPWFKIDGRSHSELFWPRITFENQRSNEKLEIFGDMESNYQYFWFYEPHLLEYGEFHTITFGCSMKLNNFPFDSHTCSFLFYTPDNGNITLMFLPVILDGDNVDQGILLGHTLPFNVSIVILEPHLRSLFGYHYYFAGLNFTFQRNNALAIITGYYVPTGLYSLLSALSFLVPKDQVIM